jgi:hypothetical protein
MIKKKTALGVWRGPVSLESIVCVAIHMQNTPKNMRY